ncbi:MAG: 1-deoxy-D-xylulose-5-phosphate synthase [candidate division WOR-3 bacterium]
MITKNIYPEDIRTLSITELENLAAILRARIIDVVLRRGGHLASSLGCVELAIALHYVFNTPEDKIIWDVGHQSYAHKLITGRFEAFETLRTYGGISGFPKRDESIYDVFDTGHSGNAISVALGIATAAKLTGKNIKSIAVIGDGSIVNGMAFEALNHAGAGWDNLIVVLNDNEMAISQTRGAMANYLNKIITGRMYNQLKARIWRMLELLPKNLRGRARLYAKKLQAGIKNLLAPSILFEELGFRYFGPLDGHNLSLLIDTFKKVKEITGPILIHVVTKKGKGYPPAEREPEKFHGVSPTRKNLAYPEKLISMSNTDSVAKDITTSSYFGETLVKLAERDPRICAITAGMCLGTGLEAFKQKFPSRFFDVGICEEHAVTFAAGLALMGLRPVVAIYATFLSRAYDQIIQDVALQNLPVIFAIDRAGIAGEDGPTHHGTLTLSYLRVVPNLVIAVPKDLNEIEQLLEFGIKCNRPFALLYPKGTLKEIPIIKTDTPLALAKAEIIINNTENSRFADLPKLIIFALGAVIYEAYEALRKFERLENVILVNLRWLKPIDEELIKRLVSEDDYVVSVEENTKIGGLGSALLEIFGKFNIFPKKFIALGLDDKFIAHGTREELLSLEGLTAHKLVQVFSNLLKEINTPCLAKHLSI